MAFKKFRQHAQILKFQYQISSLGLEGYDFDYIMLCFH